MAKKTTKAVTPEVKPPEETTDATVTETVQDVPEVNADSPDTPDEPTTDSEGTDLETTSSDTPDEPTTDTEVSDKDAAPSDTPDEPTTKTDDAPPEVKVQAAPVVAREPHHKSFFGQYISFMKSGRTVEGIKALNNCVKTVLAAKDDSQYADLIEMFKAEESFLIPTQMLQSVATIPSGERARLEVIAIIMRTLAGKMDTPISLDTARSVVKADHFIDYVAKQMAIAKM